MTTRYYSNADLRVWVSNYIAALEKDKEEADNQGHSPCLAPLHMWRKASTKYTGKRMHILWPCILSYTQPTH